MSQGSVGDSCPLSLLVLIIYVFACFFIYSFILILGKVCHFIGIFSKSPIFYLRPFFYHFSYMSEILIFFFSFSLNYFLVSLVTSRLTYGLVRSVLTFKLGGLSRSLSVTDFQFNLIMIIVL